MDEHDSTSPLEEAVQRYLPYLAFELRDAGIPNLADLCDSAWRRIDVELDLELVLRIAMDAGVSISFGVEYERRSVQVVCASAGLPATTDSLLLIQQRVQELLNSQDIGSLMDSRADFALAHLEKAGGLAPGVDKRAFLNLLRFAQHSQRGRADRFDGD